MNADLNKYKKLALSLAMVVVLNVFFNVGLETFYPAPDYNDYCPSAPMEKLYENQNACTEAGGIWQQPQAVGALGYCDLFTKCNEEWTAANEPYNRNAFITLTGLGVATLMLGLLVGSLPMAVANGLLYGGVISILIGTIRYWTLMDDYLRFIVSGVALLLLVLVGVKKLKD